MIEVDARSPESDGCFAAVVLEKFLTTIFLRDRNEILVYGSPVE